MRTLSPQNSRLRELLRVYSSQYDPCEICVESVKKFAEAIAKKENVIGEKRAVLRITPDRNGFGNTTHLHFDFRLEAL